MPATATATNYETISAETQNHVCTITLNRPDVLNAFNDQITTELSDALKNAERDQNVRAIVLTGSGRAFSSGQDLGDLKKKYVPGYVPMLGKDLRKRYNPIITRMVNMPKPIIASVNGVAAGAGCSLALACDMRIASKDAAFIEVFINVGLIPDSGSTYTLPRLVGLGKAFELCTLGSKVDAEEALRLGLVNQVVEADQLAETTAKVAGKLAKLPGKAIALTKRLLNQTFENDIAQQLEAEAFAQETAGQTEDHFEGVTAFLEKRKPEFKGQ
ncbi:MAG: 2-(1,2-epoxy-1,2-dihydrophenyl)acetyl-CoA isomerase [Phycisphaerales bacterium]|nr:MAG: 2-(1,2-epoxy-1,2-dihydrophenyl)acetyl-CoA isomerase [Phycisphaerales bacterium]